MAGALDPDTETRLWLDALKASGGGADPRALHAALEAGIRAHCGAEAGPVLARLGPPPGAPRAGASARWLKPAIAGSLLAALLAGLAWWLPLPPFREVPPPDDRDGLYFVLVDRYADGIPDPPGSVDKDDPQAWHGGDLRGVIEHLDDIERLGVGAVWISPVSDCRDEPHGPWGAYHGYWVERLDAVDPRFGSMDDLRELSEALHARGMRLYLDMVYNHVGPDAPLRLSHPDWFHHNGDITDWNDPVQLVTHDVHGLPDLAQENEAVYAHLRDVSLSVVELVEPDGFRVDAVRHLPPAFLAQLGDEIRRVDPDFELLGEVFDGNVDRLAERVRQDRLDAVFDFPLAFALREVFCEDAPVGKVASLLRVDYGARPVTLVDNHDLPRIRSACRGDDDRVGQALAFLLTARGTPSITYGTEVGLEGEKEPENRGDMVFGKEHPLGALLQDGFSRRARSPALRSPTSRIIGLSGQVMSVARLGEDETVVVSVNRGAETLSPPRWTELPGQPVEAVVIRGATVDPVARDLPPGAIRIERWDRAIQPRTGPIELTLEVEREPPLGEGDRLVLVGAGRNLGAWEPRRGVSRGTDGVFRLTVEDGEVLAFKMAVVRADGRVDWEPHPDRFLLVTSDRWTSEGKCGRSCAPADQGQARFRLAWAEQTLFEAIAAREVDRVSALLAQGADPLAQDAQGRRALEAAVDAGADRVVQQLLASGAALPPNILGRAVQHRNDRMLALLLSRGAPIDEPDAEGQTPLMVAARAGNREAVMRLLKLGADPERKDAAGLTALDHAADEGIRALLTPR